MSYFIIIIMQHKLQALLITSNTSDTNESLVVSTTEEGIPID